MTDDLPKRYTWLELVEMSLTMTEDFVRARHEAENHLAERYHESFEKALAEVRRRMDEAGISYATGLSWRQENCCLKEQIDEADRRMYQEKRKFYRARKSQ